MFIVLGGVYYVEVVHQLYQGILITILEVGSQFLLVGFLAWQFKEKASRPLFFLTVFFLILFVAEVSYNSYYFIFPTKGVTFWSVFLSHFLYAICYFVGTGALLGMVKEKKNFLFSFSTLIPIILTVPIAAKFLVLPFFQNFNANNNLFLTFSEGLSIVASFVFINMAFIVFLSSRHLIWSLFSCGVVVMMVSDWAVRIDVLLGIEPIYGFYEFLWALGTLIVCYSILIGKNELYETIDVFRVKSINCQYKLLSLVLVLVSVLGAVVLSSENASNQIKYISLTLSIGFIFSALICYHISDNLKTFAQTMGELILSRADSMDGQRFYSDLPEELKSSYKLVLQDKVNRSEEHHRQEREKLILSKYGELASQVAHDIQSPLTALNMCVRMTTHLDEDVRVLIRKSVGRIQDITNDLALRNIKEKVNCVGSENMKKQMLASAIDAVISEKRLQYQQYSDLTIEGDPDVESYGVFVSLNLAQFRRVLSNLINNSIEAMPTHKGRIQVYTKTSVDTVQIIIADSGKGIPKDKLQEVFKNGFSYGKDQGTGLGLAHAKETIESWSGSLRIESEIGEGTRVILTLPRQEQPSWFVSNLNIKPTTTVVVLDDDSTIHQVWDQRLGKAGLKSIKHFSRVDDLRDWYAKKHRRNVLFLCDFELIGSSVTGLDMIRNLNIEKKSILVTSHHDENDLQETCVKMGVRVLPKSSANSVPIFVL